MRQTHDCDRRRTVVPIDRFLLIDGDEPAKADLTSDFGDRALRLEGRSKRLMQRRIAASEAGREKYGHIAHRAADATSRGAREKGPVRHAFSAGVPWRKVGRWR